ncbi:MAG: LptF/LptG family permease [Candidatus Puniceispirillales bacterium]
MILTSYIFRQTSRSVFISTCVFLGVVWLSQSFKSIKLIVEKGADLTDFFILSFFSLPSWLLIALPLGTFAGCMISYLKLQNDKEIIVMKSAGLSPFKISKPALLVALICSLILFIISHFILPETYKNFKKLQNEIRNSNQEFILKDNIFIDINKTQTIFIGKLKNSNDLEEIFIQDRTDNLYLVEYFSKRGNLNIGEAINLMMIEGTRISTDKKGRSTLLSFDNYNITIQKDKKKPFARRVIEYNESSFFELIKKAEKNLDKRGKLLAEAHTRNTIIFMPIIFTLIVMLTILKEQYSRILISYKKTLAIGIVFVVQSLVIILKNAVHSDAFLVPLMYLFPISILTVCFIFLYTRENIYKSSFY